MGSSVRGKNGLNFKRDVFLAKPMVDSSCAYIDLISPHPVNNPVLIAKNYINTCCLGFAKSSLGAIYVPSGFVQLAELRGLRVQHESRQGLAHSSLVLQLFLMNQAGSADLPTNFLFTVHQSISCDK